MEHWEAEGRGTVCRLLIGLGLTVLTPRDRVGDCGVGNTHGAVSSPERVGMKDDKERESPDGVVIVGGVTEATGRLAGAEDEGVID